MKKQTGNTTVIGALVGLVVGGAIGWMLGQQQAAQSSSNQSAAAPSAAATPNAKPAQAAAAPAAIDAKYGFESHAAIGWVCGDFETALACKGVGHSNELHKEGLSALKFDVDLSGGSERRGSGEIWVDVNNIAPAGATGPLSLANRTVKLWVYATPGSAGNPERPNGFQIFVKDGSWKAKYGPWHDVEEGKWAEVTFPVGGASDGFDPATINAIGLKLAAGDGSKAKFAGSVYVDAVSW